MLLLTRIVHVLAVGLWFGMTLFFTFIVALSLFGTLEDVAKQPPEKRPVWFPATEHFNRAPGQKPKGHVFKSIEDVRKEQGSRAAGEVISPLFDQYFMLQAACAGLALVTSLAWW